MWTAARRRGASLVDLEAVLDGLESGALGGFATDVYPVEPPEPNPLYARDDVIVRVKHRDVPLGD